MKKTNKNKQKHYKISFSEYFDSYSLYIYYLHPAVLAIAAYDQLKGLSNGYIKSIEYIIPLTFTVILFVTLIQIFILSSIIFRKKDKSTDLSCENE